MPPDGCLVVSSQGCGNTLMAGGAKGGDMTIVRPAARRPRFLDGDLNFVPFNPDLIELVKRTRGGPSVVLTRTPSVKRIVQDTERHRPVRPGRTGPGRAGLMCGLTAGLIRCLLKGCPRIGLVQEVDFPAYPGTASGQVTLRGDPGISTEVLAGRAHLFGPCFGPRSCDLWARLACWGLGFGY